MLRAVPVVTILIGIFLLVVEFMSVREKADEKTRHKQAEAARLLSSLLTKEDAAALLHAIINKDKSPDNLE
jgi:Na+/melibiose symporter-like transporter